MIIAEFCQNHLGDMDLLHQMVIKAREAGAWAGKIQSFFADDLTDEWKHDYDRIKKCELDWDKHRQFVVWCNAVGLVPMTSVYSARYAQQIWNAGFQHVKIGSAQCMDTSLILGYIQAGFKTILSTGGHELKDIPKLGPLFAVLHCVSQYPMDPRNADLTRMLLIRKWWPTAMIGFSDHSAGSVASCMAMVLGAQVIERHFTLLEGSKTKDGPVSIGFDALKSLCDYDKLSLQDKLDRDTKAGMLVYPKTQAEKDLIAKYKTRWKR
jgi:sialic acid synthase SpsE